MQAANNYVKVEIKDSSSGFRPMDSSLLKGQAVSCGVNVSNIKKGYEVLFPASHGKAMVNIEAGKTFWYVDEDIILAYEK